MSDHEAQSKVGPSVVPPCPPGGFPPAWRWSSYPSFEENFRLWNADDKQIFDNFAAHSNRGWQHYDNQLAQQAFESQRQRQMYDFNDIRTKDLLLNAHLTDVNQLLKHREDAHAQQLRAQTLADTTLGKDLINATLISQAKHNAQQVGEYAGMLEVLYGIPLHSIDAGLSKQFLAGVVALGMQELVGGAQERIKGFEEAQRAVPTPAENEA